MKLVWMKHKTPLIFQRFYRVNQNSVIIDSSLGLSIVKQIVDLYHGKVELRRTNVVVA